MPSDAYLECGAVCAYAPLWLLRIATTSQSGAYAQTAPHSKNTASPVSSTNRTLGHHQDSDFSDMSVLRGFPPKVIWIRIGNCTTQQIEDLFRMNDDAMVAFENAAKIGLLSLF